MEFPILNGEYIGVVEVGGSVGAMVGEQPQLSSVVQLQSQFLLAWIINWGIGKVGNHRNPAWEQKHRKDSFPPHKL